MRVFVLLALLTVGLSPLARAQDACGGAATQAELTACAAREARRADAELNAVYRAVMAREGGASAARIRAGQRAWIAYRDAWCEAASGVYEGGSMRPMAHSFCVAGLTRDQTEQLRRLDPEHAPEGE